MQPNIPQSAIRNPQSEHHVYRKRIRGVRMRWFGSGCVLGVVVGVFITLLASALVVTQMPAVVQSFTGQPDVAVVIGESYLNREAANRINGSYPTGVSSITLTGANIDLKPENRMDLQAMFHVDAGIANFQISAGARNELTVQGGKLAIGMVGEPQLGNLNLPLNLLPFNLNDRIKQAIDKVNNDLLISEINKSLESGFGSSQFSVQGVTTDESGMTIRLQRGK